MELVFTAFLTGLFAGAHCVTMCGGIIGALNLPGARRTIVIHADRSASLPATDRLAWPEALSLHLAYSGGRIFSYATAGALAGVLGGTALMTQSVLPAQLVLAVLANTMLLLLAFYLMGHTRVLSRLERIGLPLWQRIAPLTKRFLPAETPARALGVGMAWGWLPCGLVYSVLTLAMMSGGPAQGAMVMAAFGLGTLPNLLAAGLTVDRLRPFLARPAVRRAAGAAIFALGVWGFARIPQVAEAIVAGIECFK